MNTLNLLSRAEMKNIVGGTEVYEIEGEEVKPCLFSDCSFEGTNGLLLQGWCGSSTNGKQCRCIADGASVPWNSCLL